MSPLGAAALAAASIAFAVAGCARTNAYAVVSPQSPADGSACLRQCGLRRSEGIRVYLGCVRACPRTRVVEEQPCETVAFDSNQFACTTEHDESSSPVEFIAGIIIGVIVFGFLAFYLTHKGAGFG
jgi:hypothetical protein